ncbi:MAG: SPOR domain-containing protein [Bacteroidaceae bacterium]|nr:SPOR domain-containing protein [Bacteroidaceae bacterium]
MKKCLVICASMALALSFTGCKSSESAYKKAYEKAKAAEETGYVAETTNTVEEVVATPVVPVIEKPAAETTVVRVEDAPVRNEDVSLVDGAGLKAYSVVVGSFGVKANADRLQQELLNKGYSAQIVRSPSNMYRVVASTSDTLSDVVYERSRLEQTYQGAWLLRKK